MIKSVTVYRKPDKSDAFTMHLNDPTNVTSKSGFAIDKITGLGPVDADINITDLVTDGGSFNSARKGTRNVVLSLIFYSEVGGAAIEDIRQRSYKLFPLKKLVYLEIETDNRTVMTKGYVEKNEPDIFREDECCEVSIICPDPKMYKVGDNSTQNVALTPEQDVEINYTGDIEVGVTIHLKMNACGSMSTPEQPRPYMFTISCTKPDGTVQNVNIYGRKNENVSGNYYFLDDDELEIVSVTSNKDAILTDGTTQEDIDALNLLPINPDWITLDEGLNVIRLHDATGSGIAEATLTADICFEGV